MYDGMYIRDPECQLYLTLEGDARVKAIDVFQGSDAEVTKAYYAQLAARGALGEVAMNLLRAQKSSARAKVYRGGVRGVGSFRRMAYERKSWSMQNLCGVLDRHGAELAIRFGWKMDSSVVFGERPSWVLYIELPVGQVSFHSPARLSAHDFSGEWDGQRLSEERILAFCDKVFWGPSTQLQLFPMAPDPERHTERQSREVSPKRLATGSAPKRRRRSAPL